MTKQRRSFTPEFKREAACLVLDQGYSHIEAARSLGVVESALRRCGQNSFKRSAWALPRRAKH
ncbi:transposase IS3/IS911 family protein [Enterobacter cloacae]|nr:transposase IS3/IS911 family protein [Enterobacter cloacae]